MADTTKRLANPESINEVHAKVKSYLAIERLFSLRNAFIKTQLLQYLLLPTLQLRYHSLHRRLLFTNISRINFLHTDLLSEHALVQRVDLRRKH